MKIAWAYFLQLTFYEIIRSSRITSWIYSIVFRATAMSSQNLTKIRPYFSLTSLINKSMFSLVPQRSTWVHDTAAFAPERRAAAHLLLSAPAARGAGSSRSISSARGALSSKPAGHRWDRQTDRQADVRPFHRSCSACYAGSINKQIVRLTRWKHYSAKLWRRYASWMGALTAGSAAPVSCRWPFVPMLSAVFWRRASAVYAV